MPRRSKSANTAAAPTRPNWRGSFHSLRSNSSKSRIPLACTELPPLTHPGIFRGDRPSTTASPPLKFQVTRCTALAQRQPSVGRQETAQLRTVGRQWWQPEPNRRSLPPGALPVPRRGKFVAEQFRADVSGRLLGKRVVRQKTECAGVVVQEFPDQVGRPRILLWHGHRREPDLPVQ